MRDKRLLIKNVYIFINHKIKNIIESLNVEY